MEFIKASDLRYRVNRPDGWTKADHRVARHQTLATRGISAYGHERTPSSCKKNQKLCCCGA